MPTGRKQLEEPLGQPGDRRSGRDPTERDPRDVAMPLQGRTRVPRKVAELLLPSARIGGGKDDLVGHLLEDELQELALVAHVPIERGRAGPEFLTHPSHREGIHAVAVEDAESRIDDRVPREWRAGPTGRGCPPSGLGDLLVISRLHPWEEAYHAARTLFYSSNTV